MDKRPEEINMINKNVILKEKFGNKISINENLSKYSWFNLGGPGEIFFRPDTDKELSNFFKNHNHGDNEITIIGAGSNTLIRDGGVKGIVIKLSSKFSYINLLDNNKVREVKDLLGRLLPSYQSNSKIVDHIYEEQSNFRNDVKTSVIAKNQENKIIRINPK